MAKMYKNILVPLDESKYDEDAVETAANLSKVFNGKITLIQVLEILPLLQKEKEEEYEILKERSDKYLIPIKQKLEKQNITTEIVVKTGTPSFVICKYAEENDIDLIVMPVYHVEKTSKILVGSVAERLFKHSPKPVLFVRKGSKDILRGRKILVVDDEPDILDIVEEELSMCVIHKAKDHDSAIELIENNWFDIAILDIMGVDGFDILKHTVRYGIPAVMLTAHALTKDALNKAAKLGATAFLPKEKMMELEPFLVDVIKNDGKPVWKKLFERLSSYFDGKFGWTPEDEKALISKYGDLGDTE
jgi:nucleotide-binding universal stress UspA family protein/CheY-like chemotaxis protein